MSASEGAKGQGGEPYGRFITLEGGEGVGKSTQITALAAALRARGLTVIETREPGGSAGAEAIRALLLHSDFDAWQPRAEALLFAAARSDHVARVIRPALAAGHWVLCDRFVDSTRAYQSVGGALDDAEIMALHRIGSEGLMPDRTLLLRLAPEEAARRRALRPLAAPDRFEERKADFHSAVAAAFDVMAAHEPRRIRVIDANAPANDVTASALAALDDLL